jgi:hypothetical protein
MPDEFDAIQERMEQEEELRRKYAPKPVTIKSIGKCLYCGTPLTGDMRFCDSDCRDDFEYMIYRRTNK